MPHAAVAVVGCPPSAAWFTVGVLAPAATFGLLPAGVRHEVERAELVHAEGDFRLVALGYDLAVGDRVEVLDAGLLRRVVGIVEVFQVFRC